MTTELEKLVKCKKVGKKWARMAAIYLRFAKDFPQADISEEAAIAMFRHESLGEQIPENGKLNGYMLGKKWMDVTIASWKEEIPQMGLLVSELIEDGYPEWFLERVGVLHLVPTMDGCSWWLGDCKLVNGSKKMDNNFTWELVAIGILLGLVLSLPIFLCG